MIASLLRTISAGKATFAGPTNFPDSKTAQALPAASRRPARFGVTATMVPAIATATEVTPTSTSPSSSSRYQTCLSTSYNSSSGNTHPLTIGIGSQSLSIGQHAVLVAHHPVDQIGGADHAGAFRNQLALAEVEEFEIAGAGIEFHTQLVRVLDEIIDRFLRAGLDFQRRGHAALHQPPGGRGTHDLDLEIHRCGDRRLKERRAQLFVVARIGIHQHYQQFLRHGQSWSVIRRLARRRSAD